MAVVGGDLETLLDACTIMGTEAVSIITYILISPSDVKPPSMINEREIVD